MVADRAAGKVMLYPSIIGAAEECGSHYVIRENRA